jgi:hypothetical protein
MDSQTSADDFINQFDRSCSCSNLPDATFGVSTGCCAKDVVDKLMVQLKEKDEQLEANKIQLEEKDKELEVIKMHLKEKIKELEANEQDMQVFEFPIILTKKWIDGKSAKKLE